MIWLASAILLTATAGLWRISHAATTADRLLGIQLLGTTGIAFLLLMAEWQQAPVWRVVALILALLAAVVTAALVQLLRGKSP
ncbi:MAG: monovalent cation/H+ antiporter complex subunit F [Pseudohongiella sp.]|nr:monovalent cation/H+ antiporter complex subunit F [Pseudohongiella sp.]